MIELIEKRQPNSKTFHLEGNKYRLQISRELLHHPDVEGKLQDINLTPEETADTLIVRGAGYTATVYKKDLRVVVKHGNNTHEIELLENADTSNYSLEGRGLKFEEAFPGVDLILSVTPAKVEWFKRIKNDKAKKNFKWRTSEQKSPFIFKEKSVGHDADGNSTEILVERRKEGTKTVLDETITGRVAKIKDKKTRIKEYQEGAKYPLMIDVPDVSVSVGAGADDAKQDIANGSTYAVYTPGTVLTAGAATLFTGALFLQSFFGVRFGSIGIPQGATVDLAKLIFKQKNVGTQQVTIFAVDVDNLAASPWTTIVGKPRTSASVAMAATTNSAFTTVSNSVTSLVQEIIDRTGWASNNGMGFVGTEPRTTGITGYQISQIAAYEHATEVPALLEIDFTVSSTGNPTAYTYSLL